MQYPYQNANLSTKQRIADLLGRMSLEEKVRQLGCTMVIGASDPASLDVKPGIGEIAVMGGGASPCATADFIRDMQQYIVQNSPHGIPAIFHCEALSGAVIPGSNMFPTSISLAAAFNPEIIRDMCERTRRQMLGLGIRQALSPVLDVSRDLRWGRISETYGGDPTLNSIMSCAFVDGLQGDDIANGVAATAKHFLGYSQTEGGLNMTKTISDDRDLREVFAKPFEAVIRKSGIKSVMNSYAEYSGRPICASKAILTDLLRDDLGFEGLVVSDYMSIPRLISNFHVAKDLVDAGRQSLMAGLDVECPNRAGYSDDFINAAANGQIDIGVIDRSVERVLALKFELGLFENPYPRNEHFDNVFDNTENDAKAREATLQLMTLTKNDGILPISDRKKRLAVIGPAGDCLRMMFSGYSYPAMREMIESMNAGAMAGVSEDAPEEDGNCGASLIRGKKTLDKHTGDAFVLERTPKAKTVFAVLKEQFDSVTFDEGCDYVGDDTKGFAQAIDAAKQADVIILTVGGKNGWGLHCTTGEGIDSASLDLPGCQEELMRAVYQANPNIVLVHTDGRPLVSEWAYENIPAILEAWLPCSYGGEAIADTISGINVPAGRLPIDVPRSVAHTPCYHYQHNGSDAKTIHDNSLNPQGYINSQASVLRPFGYGLSYTNFDYQALELTVQNDGKAVACVTVKNTGSCAGDEVVQLYGKDEIASIIRPAQELIGIKRLTLQPNQSKTVEFSFNINQLSFCDDCGHWIVEQGDFSFFAGGSSADHAVTAGYYQPETLQIDCTKRSFYAQTSVILYTN